jgi:DNA helicase-2/ATP-dependent DNA helicase PcrA
VTVVLDESQRAVVEADPGDRLLVIAGAGRGKTEVVAARIERLAKMHGLYPVDEILVLSFSRAAVRAARQRLDTSGLASAGVTTFDSFASRILVAAGRDVNAQRGFDARVRAAAELIKSGEAPDLDMLRHVVLDEVQDLVGDRAEFALALLTAVDAECGFTALGDPLQAIYDWQLDNSASQMTSSELRTKLCDQLGAREVSLDKDYRARGAVPMAVVELGGELVCLDTGPKVRERVDDFALQLDDIGYLGSAVNLVRQAGSRTAVLCRTNAVALAVSRLLRDSGVPHVLRRPLEDVGAAPWIAGAFRTVDTERLSARDVDGLLRQVELPLSPPEAWVALKSVEGDHRNFDSLDLMRLRTAMRSHALPLDLTTPELDEVVVSTIHRAKGLEFDRVLLVDQWYHLDDEDDWVEARTTYVALSRARDVVLRCRAPRALIAKHLRADRWTARKRGRFDWSWAMETKSADTDTVRPTQNAPTAQDWLNRNESIGAAVELVWESSSPAECPRYEVRTRDGLVIGRTSEQFGSDLVRVFGRRSADQPWPTFIRDVVIGAVESVAGRREDTKEAGLGVSGVWLVPRLTGMARPEWDSIGKDAD